MDSILVIAVVASGLGVAGAYAAYNMRLRSSSEVLVNLTAGSIEDQVEDSDDSLPNLDSPEVREGIFNKDVWIKIKKREKAIPFVCLAITAVAHIIISPQDIVGHLAFGLGGLGAGYIYTRRAGAKRRAELQRSTTFYLPLVIERLIMSAQAGLDILPALKSIATKVKLRADPVTVAVSYVVSLSESGVPLERALSIVAEHFDSPALRHALLHLAAAHREGGSLIGPLRELGDSTQTFFQENIDEQLAAMPVKATMPLLLAFAGLILIFLAVPLSQVLDFLTHNHPKL